MRARKAKLRRHLSQHFRKPPGGQGGETPAAGAVAQFANLYDIARLGGYGVAFNPVTIAYDRRKASRPVTSWKDIWNPEWKGRLAWPVYPGAQGTAGLLMAAKVWGGGEKSIDVGFQKIRELRPFAAIQQSQEQLFQMFDQGVCDLSIEFGSVCRRYAETQNPNLEIANPVEGQVVAINVACITVGTRNQKLAEEWINLHLSEPCSLAYSREMYYPPAVRNIEIPAELKPKLVLADDVRKLVDFDWEHVIHMQPQWSTISTAKSPVDGSRRAGARSAGHRLIFATFAAPFGVVILFSLHPHADPFAPLFTQPSAAQFRAILTNSFYLRVILETLALGAGVTLLAVVLGYPVALWLARMPVRWRPIAFAVVLVPLLTNVVGRSLGIVLLLAPDGLINQVLEVFGLGPIRGMLYTRGRSRSRSRRPSCPSRSWRFTRAARNLAARARGCAEPRRLARSAVLDRRFPPLPSRAARRGDGRLPRVIHGLCLGYPARGQEVSTTGMLVWEEAQPKLNAPTASALALIMTACSIGFIAACGFAFARLMPWLAGRPAEAWSLPARLVRALDLVAPAAYRFLLAVALACSCFLSFSSAFRASMTCRRRRWRAFVPSPGGGTGRSVRRRLRGLVPALDRDRDGLGHSGARPGDARSVRAGAPPVHRSDGAGGGSGPFPCRCRWWPSESECCVSCSCTRQCRRSWDRGGARRGHPALQHRLASGVVSSSTARRRRQQRASGPERSAALRS